MVEYLAFRTIVCAIDALPTRAGIRTAEGLAWIVHTLLPGKLTRRHVARENLRLAFGQELSDAAVDDMIRRMWIHLFRMIVEIVQWPRKLRLYNCAEIMDFRNRDQTVRAMCAGRPVIALGGHFGNWELASATFGIFGFPTGVVARDLDNPYLHRWFQRSREITGNRLISKTGATDPMVQLLQRRGAVALLCDQDAGPRGLFVPFFGKEASTFKSIALVALEYNAVLCVGYARRLADDFLNNRWVRFELGCEEIIDPQECTSEDPVREMTLKYTDALERAIRRSPEQYFWVHRRWKSDPRRRERDKRVA